MATLQTSKQVMEKTTKIKKLLRKASRQTKRLSKTVKQLDALGISITLTGRISKR